MARAVRISATQLEDLQRLVIGLTGPIGKLGRALLNAVRAGPAPRAEAAPLPGQLGLWVIDGDGLPPRPWLICGNTEFRCTTLDCTLMARVCVARQAASDAQRTRDTWRGQGSDYPHCVTDRCAQGRAIRDVLDPTRFVRRRNGAGPNGRFERGRRDAVEQHEARERLAAAGLLDEVPTVDRVDEPVGEEG